MIHIDMVTSSENGVCMGGNLIFLISQPRSGSTLLQRILGNHPDIHTLSEPWLMLHPFYAFQRIGFQAEYGVDLARVGVQNFIQALPLGRDDYVEAIRRMYAYLYERALLSTGKRLFLDKTPRYYFIIPELLQTFPKAHFIILYRNPLAVLHSIINTWTRENLASLYDYKNDLRQAPNFLINGTKVLKNRCSIIHYEQLVSDPECMIQAICEQLQIKFVPEMIEYGHKNLAHWYYGDQKNVYENTRPSLAMMDKWRQALDNPQIWRLSNDYLQLIGQKTIEQMGYPYDEIMKVLKMHQPNAIRLWMTSPLSHLLQKPNQKRQKWHRGVLGLTRPLRQLEVRESLLSL